MNRLELMLENLATELMETGVWAWQGYTGWGERGYYHFRHQNYTTKITFTVSSPCASKKRIKSLLKCELRRRYTKIGYCPGYNNRGELVPLIWHDPHSFHGVVRRYLSTHDSTQLVIA